jgi:rubrerythrin
MYLSSKEEEMEKKFGIHDVLQYAAVIEEHGERYYREAGRRLKNPELSGFFTYLADQEAGHRLTFEMILDVQSAYEPFESHPAEYFSYLRVFADRMLFASEEVEREIAGARGPLSALDFALRRELYSILYFQEVRSLVRKEQSADLGRIIEEERNHFLELTRRRQAAAGREPRPGAAPGEVPAIPSA